MASRKQLGWLVPRSSWELLERRVLDKKGSTDFYAGVEVEQMADLWLALEGSDTSPRVGYTGSPLHTNEKNVSKTPLSEQEKVKVNCRMHADTKEQLSLYASRYDVHEGVLLAYIIREYYETDGWGYSIEAVGSGSLSEQSDEETDIPYAESDKKDWICDRIEPDSNGTIHGDDIRDLIREVGAESRINHYLSGVLDQLGYVHHPKVHGLYIPYQKLNDHGVGIDDPAIYRKPYDALTREEKVEGIKAILSTRGVAMPVSRIHQEVFDGNGSTQHIRDLVHTVAESEGATYQPTAGGTKVLRVAPCDYPSEPEQRSEPKPEPESESESSEASDSDGREEIESDAAAEMDALMQGTPKSDGRVVTTDGGTDSW